MCGIYKLRSTKLIINFPTTNPKILICIRLSNFIEKLIANNSDERKAWINALRPNLNSEKNKIDVNFGNECLICLNDAQQTVVTLCGHQFCKHCIIKWIDLKPANQTCPVCNKNINKHKIVRVYGINHTGNQLKSNEGNSISNKNIQEALNDVQAEFINQEPRHQKIMTNNKINNSILGINRFITQGFYQIKDLIASYNQKLFIRTQSGSRMHVNLNLYRYICFFDFI